MSLLQEMGYTRVRHYHGGMSDWTEQGGRLAQAMLSPNDAQVAPAAAPSTRAWRPRDPQPARRRSTALIDAMGRRSIIDFLLLWLWMILGCGLVYWLAGAWAGHGLRAGLVPVERGWDGLLTALYFSCVTALSIGYGDVVPLAELRILAVAEGAAGLLIFGCLISKLVSRRQEELVEEIHRSTFEHRLGRVRTNLHLVLSELQAIAGLCADRQAPTERILARVESAATVFAGELQAIHDLLYRPQLQPDEQALESILANLAAALRELQELLLCLPATQPRSPTLATNLRVMAALAAEICGECVPREYAPALRGWMDRIRELAGRIA